MFKGRFWPSVEDKTPKATRTWVSASGTDSVTSVEGIQSPAALDQILQTAFPVYRIARNLGLTSVVNAQEAQNEI